MLGFVMIVLRGGLPGSLMLRAIRESARGTAIYAMGRKRSR
jgi:hypothetical protein